MRTYIHISIGACFFFSTLSSVQAQYQSTINFDGPLPPGTAIYLDANDTVNPWIIGTPQKAIFNEAYSQPFCIFTDTLGSVLPNDTSSFILKFRYNSYGAFGITFNTRLSFAPLDSGFLEYSFDSLVWYQPDITSTDPCGTGMTLFMAYPYTNIGNTDTMGGMDYTNLSCVPDPPYDTCYFRFTFVTDTLNSLREGWLIDDIVFYTGLQGTEHFTVFPGMKMYPNPVSDMLNLEWSESVEEDILIRIVDMQGKQVYSRLSGPVMSFPMTISLAGLQEGTYILNMVSGRRIYNQTFVKVYR